ncbi:hypothetical protein FB451DRAFT_1442814 [Mycena latifolia]|nr:hypothetical protein FB451DRAFT_1442814 [Mycena latifolia]
MIAKLEEHIRNDINEKVLTRISELEHQLGESHAALALTQEALDATTAGDEEERKHKGQKGLQERQVKSHIQASLVVSLMTAKKTISPTSLGLVHETMKGLPGIGDRDETTKKTVEKLPHPLQPDEVVDPIHLPESYRRRGQLQLLHSEDVLSHLAQLVHDLDQRSKTEAIRQQDREYAMTGSNMKAAVMRDIIVTELRKNHGAEATVGADKLVLTDYMSSEHSDCGELTHPEHEEYRAKTDNRCKELLRFYAYLKTLYRLRQEREDSQTDKKKSTAGRVKLTHFSAHPKNMNNAPPPTGASQIPYEWMVDPGWKAKVEREQKDIPTVPNPPAFTIFQLPIQSDELDAGYMGDIEGLVILLSAMTTKAALEAKLKALRNGKSKAGTNIWKMTDVS